MLRDEKDWDPATMIQTTEKFGRMPLGLKETLQTMKPKELSQQRTNRLAKEAREAKAATESLKKVEPTATKDAKNKNSTKAPPKKRTIKDQPSEAKQAARNPTTRTRSAAAKQSTNTQKPRGARQRAAVTGA